METLTCGDIFYHVHFLFEFLEKESRPGRSVEWGKEIFLLHFFFKACSLMSSLDRLSVQQICVCIYMCVSSVYLMNIINCVILIGNPHGGV